MYRVLTSFWSKPTTTAIASNKPRLSSVNSSDSSIDEESWVFVNATVSKVPSTNDSQNLMNTSWIASPPLIRSDQSPSNPRSISPSPTHHFNPIENLLIEHASMSVYEQIASRTRARRHRKDPKLNEQVEGVGEDEEDDDEDEDDDRSSVVLQYPSQHPNLSSIHHRNLNSSLSALESSTSSLVAHQRHLQRIHQRRRRAQPMKTSAKLILTNNNNNNSGSSNSGGANNIDESKLTSNKMIERQRCFTHTRTPKLVLHQPCRSNH